MNETDKLQLLNVINTVLTSIGIDSISELNVDLDLRKDLEIDSISYAELIVRIEEEFRINVNDSGKANTIGDLVTKLNLRT